MEGHSVVQVRYPAKSRSCSDALKMFGSRLFLFSASTTTALDPAQHDYHCHPWDPMGYVSLHYTGTYPSSAPSRYRFDLILTRTSTGDEGVSTRGEPNTADGTRALTILHNQKGKLVDRECQEAQLCARAAVSNNAGRILSTNCFHRSLKHPQTTNLR